MGTKEKRCRWIVFPRSHRVPDSFSPLISLLGDDSLLANEVTSEHILAESAQRAGHLAELRKMLVISQGGLWRLPGPCLTSGPTDEGDSEGQSLVMDAWLLTGQLHSGPEVPQCGGRGSQTWLIIGITGKLPSFNIQLPVFHTRPTKSESPCGLKLELRCHPWVLIVAPAGP